MTVMIEEKLLNPVEYFKRIKNLSKNIVFYGAGSKAIQTLELAKKQGIVPTCFCDANYKKI